MAHLSYKTKCILLILLITASVFLSVKFILPYFFPFLFAYWLAHYVYPIVFYLHEKLRIPKTISNIVTLLLFLFIIGALLFLLCNSLFQQVNRLIEHLPVYKQAVLSQFTNVCSYCDKCLKFEDGTTIDYLYEYILSLAENNGSLVFPTFTRQTISLMFQTFRFISQFGIMIISALLIVQDHDRLKNMYHTWFLHDDIDQILHQLSITGLTYMKMQSIIIAIVALICTTGLFFSHSSYPLLLGIIIAILDALPLFGSGTILVPWAIIKLFSHNIVGAAILMSTYLLCQITRQFLESKLLGDTLGLAPIYFVMSLFVGISLYGLTGVILGPFSILLIKTIYHIYKPKIN